MNGYSSAGEIRRVQVSNKTRPSRRVSTLHTPQAIGVAALTLVTVALAGCTSAPATPGTSAGAGASEIVASPVVATATPQTIPTPTTTPTPTLRAIGPRIDGEWAGLSWVSDSKPLPSDNVDLSKPTAGFMVDQYFQLYGWSKGYVGFEVTFGYPSDDSSSAAFTNIVAESSSDGLNWTVGKVLQMPTALEQDGTVGGVVEGPAGLLATGYQQQGGCGGPTPIQGLWLSQDGIGWTAVSLSPFGKDNLYQLDGGSAGYIATGYGADGKTPAIWVSTDGIHWSKSPSPVNAKTGAIDGATAFAGGFVLAGAVRTPEGCIGAGQTFTPSLWWSATGAKWSQAKTPSTVPGTSAWISVSRVTDHVLYATGDSYDEKTQTDTSYSWLSSDGKTWTDFKTETPIGEFYTDGSRAVASSMDAQNAVHFWAFEPDGSLRQLSETGNRPTTFIVNAGYQCALGPTGLVVTDYTGSKFYLGIPTAS